jgi:hypothetical protein
LVVAQSRGTDRVPAHAGLGEKPLPAR